MSPSALHTRALRMLGPLGDARLGEWPDEDQLPDGRWCAHIRRRLRPNEAARVGALRDIRGTPEAMQRAQAMGSLLALIPPNILAEELGV